MLYYVYKLGTMLTAKELGNVKEPTLVARYRIGPRSQRPMYVDDCVYDPEHGLVSKDSSWNCNKNKKKEQ